jgi:hypothetical protein
VSARAGPLEAPPAVRARSSRANALILAAALSVAAVFLAAQLFVPPVVGLADNGDYERVMGYAGFQHTTADSAERYYTFFRTRYAVASPGWFRGGYHSSETLLAYAARLVHLASSRDAIFDIRVLGAIHAALFLLALAGILRACRGLAVSTQAVVAALLVFFFTDVGYVAPFNSFYSQTASLLFLLLTAAVAAEAVRRGRLDGVLLPAYFGAALLFTGSKPQEAPSSAVLALFGVRLAGVRPAGAWKRPAAWLAVGLCAFGVWYARHVPRTLRAATMYQVVFDDLLAYSPNPKDDAAALDLPLGWMSYRGTNPYAPDSPLLDPGFQSRFLERTGFRRILGFYALHPDRLVGRVGRAADQAWSRRPVLGNFEKSPEHPRVTLATRFSLWSRTRAGLGAFPLGATALLLFGNLAVALATRRASSESGRLFREGIVVLVLLSGLSFAVVVLAQAPTDESRSLYAHHALCDLLLIADAGWIVETLAARNRVRRVAAAAASAGV